MIDHLVGLKFRIGRRDCYTLANSARYSLGKSQLPKYYNYIANSYDAIIRQGLEEMTKLNKPVNGCLVVIVAESLALGVYLNGNVLCFNSRMVSVLVPIANIPVYGFYD
jgi:hypothetical protein